MSIRATKNTKDHLQKSNTPILSLVPATNTEEPDSLKFWTLHKTKPCLVDLTPFRDGGAAAGKKNGWVGAFSGRPALIAELAPILKDTLITLAPKSVEQYLVSLRAWWRLFDAVEASAHQMLVVSSVAHVTDLHRQYAFDNNMHPSQFSAFVKVLNSTRLTFKLKQYYWVAPERPDAIKHLPPAWQTDLVRHEFSLSHCIVGSASVSTRRRNERRRDGRRNVPLVFMCSAKGTGHRKQSPSYRVPTCFSERLGPSACTSR